MLLLLIKTIIYYICSILLICSRFYNYYKNGFEINVFLKSLFKESESL